MELIPVLIIRLLVPFTIRKWPFWGGIASMVADGIDLPLLNMLGWEGSNGIAYQSIDKFLDTYYLAFEWVVVLGAVQIKDQFVRRGLSFLFLLRAFGVALFEITHIRFILFFTPNIFEYVYLVLVGRNRFFAHNTTSERKIMAYTILIATPIKLLHEYILHVAQYPLGIRRMLDLTIAFFKKLPS